MRALSLPIIFLLSINCPQAFASTVMQSDKETASVGATSNAFQLIDNFFVATYGPVSHANQLKSRPMLVVNGATYNLLEEDGSVKSTAGKVRQFDELKAVAHLGPCIYAIGALSWSNPKDQTWLATMTACKEKVENAMSQVDSIDWSSNAWPGGEVKLKEFVKASLGKVKEFAQERITSKSFSREDYAKFARAYLPTMTACFYLETLNGTYDTLRVLKQWKAEMGDEKWKKIYVVIAGGQARATGGLTPDTNPAALVVASLMDPSRVSTHIIMAPASATTDAALQGVGNALTASDLADAMYGTEQAPRGGDPFYYALKHCEIPLALDNVREILKSLSKGKAKDPILGLGPKEQG